MWIAIDFKVDMCTTIGTADSLMPTILMALSICVFPTLKQSKKEILYDG